jgi:hypothetical protein
MTLVTEVTKPFFIITGSGRSGTHWVWWWSYKLRRLENWIIQNRKEN